MNIMVKNCARCDGDHEIDIVAFTRHPVDDFTHFGICKNVNEPVLVKLLNFEKESDYGQADSGCQS